MLASACSGHGFKFASVLGGGRISIVRTIVCFGDSNTYGANAVDQARYPREVRWTGVMRRTLGAEFEVIEEGLGGRTTMFVDPLGDDRSGAPYLQPCLWSHAPVDLVTIMLGTNDLKSAYRLRASEIALAAGHLVDLARRSLAGPAGTSPRVLLISPPPLAEATAKSELWGFGGSRAESQLLAKHYALIAQMRGAAFFDAGSVIQTSPVDGVHLEADAHAVLGRVVAGAIRAALDGDATS
jgi:lysophospholipase L1-like esterase